MTATCSTWFATPSCCAVHSPSSLTGHSMRSRTTTMCCATAVADRMARSQASSSITVCPMRAPCAFPSRGILPSISSRAPISSEGPMAARRYVYGHSDRPWCIPVRSSAFKSRSSAAPASSRTSPHFPTQVARAPSAHPLAALSIISLPPACAIGRSCRSIPQTPLDPPTPDRPPSRVTPICWRRRAPSSNEPSSASRRKGALPAESSSSSLVRTRAGSTRTARSWPSRTP